MDENTIMIFEKGTWGISKRIITKAYMKGRMDYHNGQTIIEGHRAITFIYPESVYVNKLRKFILELNRLFVSRAG